MDARSAGGGKETMEEDPFESFVGRGRLEGQSYEPRVKAKDGLTKEADQDEKDPLEKDSRGIQGDDKGGRGEKEGGTMDMLDGDATYPRLEKKLSILPASQRSKNGYSGSLQRSRSSGDGHGFTVHKDDEEEAAAAAAKDEENGVEEKQFEVQWDGEGDPMNPRNLGTGRKWAIVLVISAGSTCVTCTSSMYTLTYDQITVEFGVSRVVATLGLSLFVMGLGIGPMLLGPPCQCGFREAC